MVKVLFFGILSSKTGCKETEVELGSREVELSVFMDGLRERFKDLPKAAYMIAVNKEQATLKTIVRDNDEVAIMPPFSGGSR
ncbi:MAG: MoaD/ThiS family protein [Deltaproteobacteria bacterium]